MIKGNITANRKCQFKTPSWHQDHQLISNQTNGNVKTNTLIINYRAAENGDTVVTLLKTTRNAAHFNDRDKTNFICLH